MPTKNFPGKLSSLPKIATYVVKAAKKAGFNEKETHAVELAVEEACANIITHAYGGEKRGKITCTCQVEGNELTITLRDKGKPFNPEAVQVYRPDVDLQQRKPGGAGLFLIRRLMDKVQYEFTSDGNILTLIKRKSDKE